MFDSVVLDVFIGLTLIYLLYSLMATAIQEIIAQWFGLRNRMLMKAIRRMLMDEGQIKLVADNKKTKKNTKTANFWLGISHFFSSAFKRVKLLSFLREILLGFVRFFYPWFLDRKSFTKAFYESPSIKYLGESSWHSRPSYIDAATFSQTVIYLLRGENLSPTSNQMDLIRNSLYNTGTKNNNGNGFTIHNETLQCLRNYYVDSTGDVSKFKINLENWFGETMLRASGWYKKQTQILLFLAGFIIAWQFNVDSIQIYKILSTDKKVREQMVNMAIQTKGELDKINQQQQKRNKVDSANKAKQTDDVLFSNYSELQTEAKQSQSILGLGRLTGPPCAENYFGWLITAIAISLGAPFWFDLLSKFISLRAAGPKPAGGASTNNKNDPNADIQKVG